MDKVQKIREEVERLKGWNNNVRNSTRHMTLQEEDFNRGKHSSYLEILDFIDSMQEEHVSEELEEAAENHAVERCRATSDMVLAEKCKWSFKAGAEWQKEHLWKPADGDELPIIDREVIALLNNGKVVFAHRPPEYWDGKDIITGKVTRNYVERYDKGLWNIPNVKYWLDVDLPK